LNSSPRSFFVVERVDFLVEVEVSAASKWTLGVLPEDNLLCFLTGGLELKSTLIGPSITPMGLESVV
jgi:hypothetical protein